MRLLLGAKEPGEFPEFVGIDQVDPGVVQDLPAFDPVRDGPESQESSVFPSEVHEFPESGFFLGRNGSSSTPLEVL